MTMLERLQDLWMTWRIWRLKMQAKDAYDQGLQSFGDELRNELFNLHDKRMRARHNAIARKQMRKKYPRGQ